MSKSETNEAGTDNEVRRIELATQRFLPELGDISRGLSQHMLGLFRERGKPWPALMYSEQEAIAWAIRDACQDAVGKVYGLVAGLGLQVAPAKCKTITVDDKGVTIKLALAPLFGSVVTGLQGRFLPLTLADMDRFSEIRQELDIAAAQSGLPLTEPAAEAAGNTVSHDLETGEVIELGDETGTIVPPPPPAGDIQQLSPPANSDVERRRQEQLADPEGCGYRDALQGFNPSRSLLEEGTEAYQRYGAAHARGEVEREKQNANRETGRRRRRRGSDGADTETAA